MNKPFDPEKAYGKDSYEYSLPYGNATARLMLDLLPKCKTEKEKRNAYLLIAHETYFQQFVFAAIKRRLGEVLQPILDYINYVSAVDPYAEGMKKAVADIAEYASNRVELLRG